METWSVGQLAAATGLTVRTLHHWDSVGLLVPSQRTGAGHRRYARAELERLERIAALRRLGLPLTEIATALDREGPDLRAAVQRQLDQVEEEAAAAARLRDLLARLLQALDAGGEASADELMHTIEVMTMHERYYTDEQLAQLAERREQLGEDGMARVQQEWVELIAEMRAAMEAGTDPADPSVQALSRRWKGLLEQFTGGDPETHASLQRMYSEQGVEKASQGTMDPDVMAYAARAQAALD